MTSLTSYPGMREHLDRMAYIAKDHWRPYESNAEHAERVANAEVEAQELFDRSTEIQSAVLASEMRDTEILRGLLGHRAHDCALWRWYASTQKARELMARTFDDLMRDGEVSEETGELWDALDAKQAEAA
jgi:hypothetical protein